MLDMKNLLLYTVNGTKQNEKKTSESKQSALKNQLIFMNSLEESERFPVECYFVISFPAFIILQLNFTGVFNNYLSDSDVFF